LISALSVAAWISSNIAAGEYYANYFVLVWNGWSDTHVQLGKHGYAGSLPALI
jgi:hypothetical protein